MAAAMSEQPHAAVWFPAVRTGTGTDVFTETLVTQLQRRGVHCEITWLPLRAEYAPWTVAIPEPPEWATAAHINTWLHPRFLPSHLPVVATLHHAVHHPDLEPYKGRLRAAYHKHWIRPIERASMRRADRVIAVSQFAADTARQTLLDCPMQVIHNGVDTERFHPPAQRRPHKPFRLLYVGTWMSRKGVDRLAPIMRKLGGDFELRYTGGPAADKDRAGRPGNMRDIGRLHNADEVVSAMHDADALLFPSRSEGLPLAVLEAMACRLPVIATRGSSIVEIVTDEVTGLLCPRDNIAEFVSACKKMADDPGRHRQMADSARNCVVKSFSIDSMIDAYLETYRSLEKGTNDTNLRYGE